MTSAWVGVFYRIDTMQITRVVVPDSDAGLSKHIAATGESMVRLSRAIYNSLGGPAEVAVYLALSP